MPRESASTGPIAVCAVRAGSVPIAQAAKPIIKATVIIAFNVLSPLVRYEELLLWDRLLAFG
jgi:hypothetical protein